MEKSRMSKIMVRTDSDTLCSLAQWVEEKHPVTVLKEPAKTPVMLPMREPVRGTPFYIGELLATEAMVEVEGARGIGICMGDDFGKALSMAIIDATYNAGLDECLWLTERLETMESQQLFALRQEAALHRATKVSFDTLEGH
jgi:alpha-D-ribose 1-methylphosphonate 5-triphosphate synthase subunit PhnG